MWLLSLGYTHRRLAPDNFGVHFPFLEEILNFLTSPILIGVPPIISFMFLLLLKAVIGCPWNSSNRLLLV